MKIKRSGIDAFPVDTEYDMWLEGTLPFSEVLEKIKEKWPETSLDDIEINSEYHHQYAVGYDLYCSGDYVNYIYIRNITKG